MKEIVAKNNGLMFHCWELTGESANFANKVLGNNESIKQIRFTEGKSFQRDSVMMTIDDAVVVASAALKVGISFRFVPFGKEV